MSIVLARPAGTRHYIPMSNANSNASIAEAGNGFPDIGDYVSCDGELWLIKNMSNQINTGGMGCGNWCYASLELADWGDLGEDEEPFPAHATMD